LSVGGVGRPQPGERHDRAREGDERRQRGDPARGASRDPSSCDRDRDRSRERGEQADPGARDHRVALATKGTCLVDVEWDAPSGHRHDEAEADRDFRGGDGHHREREDLSVERALLPRECHEGEVRCVQHDLEREQDDERAPPEHHAESSDPEEDRRDDQIPADIGAVHQAASSFSRVVPRTTPPTAATRSTIEVISNASRWSVRKTSPIWAGLPKEPETSAGSARLSPQASPRTTTISTSSAAAATTAAVRRSGGPPAHGASARPPRYATTKRNITITAPAYTSTCAAATNSAESSRKRTA